ncbi:unnamed protein product [Paramecium sonneborni]|uniref:Uncharacterized protein n=1 Tax=Paramecium sonneborni TaxID=65129 RepID=A0A8S1LH02_9CILI|nr:unnamed protein product [Paramecium sonneborni]
MDVITIIIAVIQKESNCPNSLCHRFLAGFAACNYSFVGPLLKVDYFGCQTEEVIGLEGGAAAPS